MEHHNTVGTPAAPDTTELVYQEHGEHGLSFQKRQLAVNSAESVGQQEFNLFTILKAIRRKWFVGIVVGLAVGAAVACCAWRLIPAHYSGYSEILVRSNVAKLPMSKGPKDADFKVLKQTHMKLVKSRLVLKAALRDKRVAQLALVQEQKDPIHWLEEELQVKSSGTEFFRIQLSGARPKDLAAIVNAVTNAYMVEVVDRQRKSVDERLKILSRLHADASDVLEAKRRAYYEEKKTNAANAEQSNQQQQSLLDRANDLESRLTDVQIQLMNFKIIDEARKTMTGRSKPPEITDEELDAQLAKTVEFRELHRQIHYLKRLLELQKETLSASHPDIVKTEKSLKNKLEKLAAFRDKSRPVYARRLVQAATEFSTLTKIQAEHKVAILRAQEKHLQSRLDDVRQSQKKAGISSAFIATRGKEVDRQEQFTNQLAGEIERTTAELVLRDFQPRIQVVQPAESPRHPNYKKRITGTAMAGLGVFGMILASAVYFDLQSRRISSMQQVSQLASVPFLGALPLIPRLSLRSAHGGRWNSRTRHWYAMLRESIDAVRTMLIREADYHGMKAAMITSAMNSEGKTTISSHLASSFARAGRRVLLIDGDLRQSTLHRTFDIPQSPGLSELLRGECPPEECLYCGDIPGLSILPAGKFDKEALEALSQDRFGNLMSKWRKQFDFVIVDSAPIMSVTDSLLMAQHVDCVLFSILRDVSRAMTVSAAFERLSLLGAPLLGAVAIGLDNESHNYRYPTKSAYGMDPYDPAS